MENTETTLFREKNLKKAVEPEQLDGYLKVTGFGPWFVVLAAALVLAAIFVWAFLGKIQPIITGAGYCESGTLICYVARVKSERSASETVTTTSAPPSQGTPMTRLCCLRSILRPLRR